MGSRPTNNASTRQGAATTQQEGARDKEVSRRPEQSRRKAGTVSVEISGKRLSIRTDHDPIFVQQLARYVDDKLGQLQSMAPSAPFEKLMLLASLTLAEELFEAQDELVNLRNDLSERTEAMIALIEEEAGRLGG